MSNAFGDACLVLAFVASRCRVPVPRKPFTKRDTVDLLGTGESRYQAVIDNKHSLHL